MTLEISINPDGDSPAADGGIAGKDVSAFVSQLVEQAAAKPSLDEMLAPLRRQFAESGATDEQLVEDITAAQGDYPAKQNA